MKTGSTAMVAFVAVIMLDTILSNFSDVINRPETEPTWRIIVLSALVGAAVWSGIHLAHGHTRKVTNELGLKRNDLVAMSRTINAVQYVLSGLLIMITIQIIFQLQYFTALLVSTITLGYLTGAVMTGVASYKFFQWYRSNREKIVFLYLLSATILAAVLVSTIIAQSVMLLQAEPYAVDLNSFPKFPASVTTADGGSDAMPDLLMGSYLVAFLWLLLTWAASAIMLNRYFKKTGERTSRLWPLFVAPAVSMVVVTIPWLLAAESTSPFDGQLTIYRMIGISAILAQGILAALAFLVVARKMRTSGIQNSIVQYVKISAIGITILFISLPANVAAGSFPPFGVVSYSCVALGSYLFLAGIYSSAVSISANSKLRDTIRKSLMNQPGLIDSVGIADLSQELQKHVTTLIKTQKDAMKKETVVDSSLSETDVRDYLQQVIDEIKRDRLKRSNTGNSAATS